MRTVGNYIEESLTGIFFTIGLIIAAAAVIVATGSSFGWVRCSADTYRSPAGTNAYGARVDCHWLLK